MGLCFLDGQWHGWWWPGDARSQGINIHGINLVRWEYDGHIARGLKKCDVEVTVFAIDSVIFNMI